MSTLVRLMWREVMRVVEFFGRLTASVSILLLLNVSSVILPATEDTEKLGNIL